MNEDIETKLKKLEKLEAARKLSSKKYFKKAAEEGKRQISVMLSQSAYAEICNRRNNNKQTASQIIEKALMETKQYLK